VGAELLLGVAAEELAEAGDALVGDAFEGLDGRVGGGDAGAAGGDDGVGALGEPLDGAGDHVGLVGDQEPVVDLVAGLFELPLQGVAGGVVGVVAAGGLLEPAGADGDDGEGESFRCPLEVVFGRCFRRGFGRQGAAPAWWSFGSVFFEGSFFEE